MVVGGGGGVVVGAGGGEVGGGEVERLGDGPALGEVGVTTGGGVDKGAAFASFAVTNTDHFPQTSEILPLT
ncbi:MAG: hypothetical protein ACRDYB_03425 [Acidimicrobiales bacterium]